MNETQRTRIPVTKRKQQAKWLTGAQTFLGFVGTNCDLKVALMNEHDAFGSSNTSNRTADQNLSFRTPFHWPQPVYLLRKENAAGFVGRKSVRNPSIGWQIAESEDLDE